MLENLGKPVILTGSQIPLASVYTDATQNLKLSIIFAAAGEFNEVRGMMMYVVDATNPRLRVRHTPPQPTKPHHTRFASSSATASSGAAGPPRPTHST